MRERTKIIYVSDPMCGWCYAFSPIIRQLAIDYKNDFDFELLNGGMVVGEREGLIGDFANYVLNAYPQVEAHSGIKFGEPYLNKLRNNTLYNSSVLPSIAMEVFKSILPLEVIAFSSAIQHAIFFEGKDGQDIQTYIHLAQNFGIDAAQFSELVRTETYKIKTYEGFEEAAKLGVNGYPAVLALHNGTYYSLSRGFAPYAQMEMMFEKLKSM